MPRSRRRRNGRNFARHRPPAASFQPIGQGSLSLASAFLREATVATLERCAVLFGPAPDGGYTAEQHLTALRALDGERHPIISAGVLPLEDWLTEELNR